MAEVRANLVQRALGDSFAPLIDEAVQELLAVRLQPVWRDLKCGVLW